MDPSGLVSAVSAGVASAVVAGGAFRRYWGRREARNRAGFRRDVEQIVSEAMAGVLARQGETEARLRRHLDAQDRKLDKMAAEVTRHHGPPGYAGKRRRGD